MKNSIRKRILAIFVFTMLATVLLGIFLNSTYLEDYYLSTREEDIVGLFDYVNEVTANNDSFDNELVNRLTKKCEDKDSSILIVSPNNKIDFECGPGYINMHTRMSKLLFGTDDMMSSDVISYEEDKLYLSKIYINATNSEYLEVFGYLSSGSYILIWNQISNVTDIAKISNEFYAVISILSLGIGFIMMCLVSLKFTRPIRQLALLSERMSDLDFSVKYTGEGTDEVAVLGHSMNTMSQKIQDNIAEIKSKNIELQKDIEKKTEIDEMRKEFISNVSHELKTPIALIQGYAEGLKESVNSDPESRDYYCDVIIDEANRMNKMVRELLSLNQIESGKANLTFERFNIVEVIAQVIKSYKLVLEQKKVTVLFDATLIAYVWTDEYRIQEVISNYISNALNHIDGENVIKIIVKSDDKKVRVEVHNTGKNIPEDSIDRIWEKFYKVDKARTREYGGNGIGLSIVKASMKALNNKYGVENEKGGVMFWFEVDLG